MAEVKDYLNFLKENRQVDIANHLLDCPVSDNLKDISTLFLPTVDF